MILFNILSPKQPFLCPKISISRMLISFNKQYCRWKNPFRMDKLPRSCHWLIISALYTILRNLLQDPAPFKATATLPLTSSCQPP